MLKFALLLIFFLLANIQFHGIWGDNVRSIDDMDKLLKMEKTLYSSLKSYVQMEKQRLNKISDLYQEITDGVNGTNLPHHDHAKHPLAIYLLIKRFLITWKNIEIVMNEDLGKELSSTYKNLQDYFPEEKDLNETANAILRLQEVYDLTEENLANGKIAGIKNAINSLNWKDCLLISQVAESNGLFNRSCRWAQQALYQLPLQEYNDTNFPVHDLKTVLKRIITIFYTTGQTREARMYIQKLLRLDPKDEFIVKNIQISMLSRKKKGSKTRTVLKTLKVMDNASLVNQQATARYQRIRELCIGNENLPAKSSGHHLKCYYFYPSSKTRFMPYAIEEMSRDPLIILYHNLTSNAEMESLKALAAKQLQPAGVYHTTSADNRNLEGYTRIAKMAFILDEESAVASAITQRLQDVTGLNMNFSEPLQVINYGIAGQYTPHYDTFPAKSGDRSHPSHDRLATAILYLSDVERGGATVFTNINVRVLPRKGNVIIWYNYLPDGNLHPGTLHAGCPVLVGSKWIANKWIQSKGQMLQSPRNGG